MPDTDIEDVPALVDGIFLEDATPDKDGDFSADMIMVGINGLDCHTYDPEVLGLAENVAKDVAYVIQGDGCKTIYVAPSIPDDCTPQNIIPADSGFEFQGTLFAMAKDGGYDLRDGELVYRAFDNVCDIFPGTSIKALGIELKPMGPGETIMQGRIELDDLGKLLLRVHIWKGKGRIISLTGEEFVDLTTGSQILTDGSLNLLEQFSENPPEQSMLRPADEALLTQSADDNMQAEVNGSYREDPGCNVSLKSNYPPDAMSVILGLVASLLVAKAIRQLTGRNIGKAIGDFFKVP